jgi:hypothetical protein
MVLELLALGLGIRAFIGAVQLARKAQSGPVAPASPSAQSQVPARMKDEP